VAQVSGDRRIQNGGVSGGLHKAFCWLNFSPLARKSK